MRELRRRSLPASVLTPPPFAPQTNTSLFGSPLPLPSPYPPLSQTTAKMYVLAQTPVSVEFELEKDQERKGSAHLEGKMLTHAPSSFHPSLLILTGLTSLSVRTFSLPLYTRTRTSSS